MAAVLPGAVGGQAKARRSLAAAAAAAPVVDAAPRTAKAGPIVAENALPARCPGRSRICGEEHGQLNGRAISRR